MTNTTEPPADEQFAKNANCSADVVEALEETTRLRAEVERLKKLAHDARHEMRRAIDNVMGVEVDAMNGNNLAVTLCTYFDNPDQETDDETCWTPDATAAYEAIKQAVKDKFLPAERLFTAALQETGDD